MEPPAETPEDETTPAAEPAPDSTLTYDPVDEARRLRAREAAAGIPGLEGFALVVTDGPHQGTHWNLARGRNEAGRNVSATLFLDDITVSRHHAAFLSEQGRLWVEDLGSTNGTYVNGKRAERAELNPGDEVIIGRFHLVVARGA
jgi:pSer/pThr/pTyr-binding forkhead associated (FHA) protein